MRDDTCWLGGTDHWLSGAKDAVDVALDLHMAVGHVLRGLMSDWICIGSMERISLDSVSSRSHSRRRAAARRRVSSD